MLTAMTLGSRLAFLRSLRPRSYGDPLSPIGDCWPLRSALPIDCATDRSGFTVVHPEQSALGALNKSSRNHFAAGLISYQGQVADIDSFFWCAGKLARILILSA
jgi:hypothetical protein